MDHHRGRGPSAGRIRTRPGRLCPGPRIRRAPHRNRGPDGAPNTSEQLPVLLAVSDGGPQMVSGTTREFMALHALAMHIGRPGTPTDQAHIESFFGHTKGEWPHLEQIRDPAILQAALEEVRVEYNTIRLHAGIGYVTPDDEHEQRGEQIRKLRREGLAAARAARIAYRRNNKQNKT